MAAATELSSKGFEINKMTTLPKFAHLPNFV